MHVIAIIFVEIAFTKAGFNMKSSINIILLGVIAFIVCMIMALISYNYFEKRFLKLKDKFAFIVKK